MERYQISGMTCGHCAQAVTREVEKIPKVERAVVDLSRGELTVDGSADEQAVRGAVIRAGYTVEARLPPPAA